MNNNINCSMECFNCRQQGHYANQCPLGKSKCNAICSKCGVKGHYANQCYPKIEKEVETKRRRFNDNSNSKKLIIYILKLKGEKYYVGKTFNLEARLKEHKNGTGCFWTSLHPFESVEKIIEDCDEFDEDKYVKIYMCKYGIYNVRGGSYSQIALDDSILEFLEKEMRTARDECLYCGGNDHFIRECFQNPLNDICFSCKEIGHITTKCPNYKNWTGCNNCGRKTHFSFRCGREEDIFGRRVTPAVLHTFWIGIKSFMEYYK